MLSISGSCIIFTVQKYSLSMNVAILTTFISPFLPFLLNLGKQATEKATESAAEKFGEAAWEKAKSIWQVLHPKVKTKESVQEAINDVTNQPKDEDFQTVLRVQLKKLLEQDQALSRQISEIMEGDASDGTPGIQIIQNVTGNQNQVFGQMSGGQIFGNVQGNVTIQE